MPNSMRGAVPQCVSPVARLIDSPERVHYGVWLAVVGVGCSPPQSQKQLCELRGGEVLGKASRD